MNSIKKWLQANGFNFREVMLTGDKPGLMVNTDYDGPYPTKECLQKQYTISAKVKRCRSLKAEARGYYTAILIIKA